MKRRFMILFVFCIVIFLYACSSDGKQPIDTETMDTNITTNTSITNTDTTNTELIEESKEEIKDDYEEAVQAKRGFPQHTSYTDGVIKPSHVSQEELDQATIELYDEWKDKYIKEKPDSEGRYYVWYSDGDWFQYGSEEEKIATTVSEAHGYGMLIVATMAGYDPEAKKLFDGMFHYFEEHRSAINPNLMAWQQGEKNGKTMNISGVDSATDGDMDIAYALLIADRQWGSDGKINYLAEALKVIGALMDSCIDPEKYIIRVGDWASSGYYRNLTRTSDFMLGHFKEYKKATDDERWDQVINKTYSLIEEVYTTESSNTGLLPDFLLVDSGKVEVPSSSVLEGEYDGAMNYNACRTFWRITTDYIMTGDDRALNQINKLNEWIIETTDGDPRKINPGYYLNGDPIPNRNYSDLSFTAPFIIPAMVNAENQQWVNALWDLMLAADTQNNLYYGNTIRLINAIIASGNWVQL